MNVDQTFVGPDLEVLTGVLVLERAPDHRVDVPLRRQGNRARDCGTGSLRRLDDLRRRPVELVVVVPLQTDADFLLSHSGLVSFSVRMGSWHDLMTAVTTPAPTLRPPSRTANRRP